MYYAISDLHGCYEKYIEMIKRICLTDADTLFVLGDVVDRGAGGIKILFDMLGRKNVVPIIGNHDYCARTFLSMLNNGSMSKKTEILYQHWLMDGGEVTKDCFLALDQNRQKLILSYLSSFSLYETATAGGNEFMLCHTVPSYEEMMSDKIVIENFIVGEPEYEKRYFDNKYLVTGHTPTGLIHPPSSGKILQINGHICIDCGAVFNKNLGCIRLDDMCEFYV